MATRVTFNPDVAMECFLDFRSASARARELAREFAEATSIRRIDSGFAVVRAARGGIPNGGAPPRPAQKPAMAAIAGTSLPKAKAPSRPKALATKTSNDKRMVRIRTAQAATSTKTSSKKPATAKPVLVPPGASGGRPTAQVATLGRMSRTRANRMVYELRYAFDRMPQKASTAWIQRTLGLFASVLARRVENLGVLGLDIAEWVGRELIDVSKATLDGRLGTHVTDRSRGGKRKVGAIATRMKRSVQGVLAAYKNDPRTVGPDLMVASLAALISSGGLDGNGGVPDSDIALLGIDAHRSLLTHSVLSGAVIESGLFSLVDFIASSHSHLPAKHDRYWDVIHARSKGLAKSGAQGVSLGLAYHLGVDSVLQPGAYHDLPFSMPIEAHQTVLGANAVAEGRDAGAKTHRTRKRSGAPAMKSAPYIPKKRDHAATAVGVAAALAAWIFGIA